MGVSWNGYIVVYPDSWLIYNGKTQRKIDDLGVPPFKETTKYGNRSYILKKKRASAKLCASTELSNGVPTLCQSVDGTMLSWMILFKKTVLMIRDVAWTWKFLSSVW